MHAPPASTAATCASASGTAITAYSRPGAAGCVATGHMLAPIVTSPRGAARRPPTDGRISETSAVEHAPARAASSTIRPTVANRGNTIASGPATRHALRHRTRARSCRPP